MAASTDPPCGKRNKTCTPPDDDVILYGADLNIIMERRASSALCNSGHSDTQAFTRTIWGRKDGGGMLKATQRSPNRSQEEQGFIFFFRKKIYFLLQEENKYLYGTGGPRLQRDFSTSSKWRLTSECRCPLLTVRVQRTSAETQIRDYGTQSGKKIIATTRLHCHASLGL